MKIKSEDLKERLMFPRGVLLILKETRLFGWMMDKALDDMDCVMKELDEIANEIK